MNASRLTVLGVALSLGLATASAGTNASESDNFRSQSNPKATPGSTQVRGVGDAGSLLVGVTDFGPGAGALLVDLISQTTTQAFDDIGLSAAAYDPVNNRVLFTHGGTLSEWPIGGTLTPLGQITNHDLPNLYTTGLTLGNGTLFGCNSTGLNETIYTINLQTQFATVYIDYADDDFDCGGLEFNPDDGALYMTNDDTSPLGSGLYRMNLDGTGTLVTEYPAGETDIDGLAIGNGRAYLITDEPGLIHVYDFALGAYQALLTSPVSTPEEQSAGAWIPPDMIFSGFFE